MTSINSAVVRGVRFQRAETKPERESAIRLIEGRYVAELGHVPADAFDDVAHFLIAKSESDEILAALRYLPPQAWPFDLGDYVDLSSHLEEGRSFALIGRLAVHNQCRRIMRGHLLQLEMLRLACHYAIGNQVTDIIIYTFAELLRLYEAVRFKRLGVAFFHPVAQRTMTVLRLDLVELCKIPPTLRSSTERFLLSDSSEALS